MDRLLEVGSAARDSLNRELQVIVTTVNDRHTVSDCSFRYELQEHQALIGELRVGASAAMAREQEQKTEHAAIQQQLKEAAKREEELGKSLSQVHACICA